MSKQREIDFNQMCMNQRRVDLSSGVTEQASVASQAGAKPMALTGTRGENSPTATLDCHNGNIQKNILLHFEVTHPAGAACCVPLAAAPAQLQHLSECPSFGP